MKLSTLVLVVAVALGTNRISARGGMMTTSSTNGPRAPTLRVKDARATRTMSATNLVFGASPLAGIYTEIDAARAHAVVKRAAELGFDKFDTAPHYGLGLSERRLGEGLREAGMVGKAKVYTKVGRVMKPREEVTENDEVEWGNVPGRDGCIFPGAPRDVLPVLDYTESGFERSHEDSLARLGLERVEGVRIHDAETPERFEAAMKGARALRALRDAGRIGEVSLGMNDAKYVLRMIRESEPGTFDAVMMAGSWNLLDQDGLEVLLECQERKIRVYNAGIFASGLLVGGSHYKYGPPPEEVKQRTEQWKQLAAKHSVPLPAVAIAFALAPQVVEFLAVGVKTPEEVEQNIAWLESANTVPTELWREAKTMGLIAEDVPVPSDE